MSTSTESRNHEILSEHGSRVQNPGNEWIVAIEGRVKNLGNPGNLGNPDKEKEPSIFGNWGCLDDFGASFIPETLKLHYVAWMMHSFGLNVRSYLEYMQTKVDLAWSYYDGVDEKFHTTENSKRFIEHLLVSSCFLILWMVCQPRGEHKKVIKEKMNDQTSKNLRKLLAFYNNDPLKSQIYMLTMNYQIPLFVLEAIYTDFSNIGNLLDTPIHKLALPCFPRYLRVNTSKVDGGAIPEGGFKHLLHIFHWSRSPDGEYLAGQNKFLCNFHIPSATELQLSRTVFVNDEVGSIDVSYSENRRLSGVLKLTPLHFCQYSTKLYEDLLIFEQRYRGFRKPFVTYVACMACLVKTEEDVRVLRENGVIPCTTFDDKEVLSFIQEVKTFMANDLVCRMSCPLWRRR